MAIVEFSINKSRFKIECPESEKPKLLELAKKVNNRANKIAKNFPTTDEKTLLAICCLTIEDEIESKKKGNKHEEEIIDNTPIIEEARETELLNHAKDIENVAQEIENLAKKIEGY